MPYCNSVITLQEIAEIKTLKIPGISGFKVDESNVLVWECLVVPTEVPYNHGAFRIQVTFPEQYPFKPPTVLFKTQIYHPNVDEKGNVCLTVINPDNWKPATKASNVLADLVQLVNHPEVDHPLRVELAEEYTKVRFKILSFFLVLNILFEFCRAARNSSRMQSPSRRSTPRSVPEVKSIIATNLKYESQSSKFNRLQLNSIISLNINW